MIEAQFIQHWELAQFRARCFWQQQGHLLLCEYKDIRQYAAVALIKCLDSYQPGRPMSVRSFIWSGIPWRMIDELRRDGLMLRGRDAEVRFVPIGEAPPASLQYDPREGMERRAACQVLREQIRQLEPRQRLVIEASLGGTLPEAARQMGVTLGRACQIRKQAIGVLRERINAQRFTE